MTDRKSGILLHITSLPGNEGMGTLGENAFQFVDFLVETGLKIWQILPLGSVGFGNSPYQSYSAFAGNPLLIDLELLVKDKFLDDSELSKIPSFSKSKVEFEKIARWKYPLLRKAFNTFKKIVSENFHAEYNSFLSEHSWWLNDYAFFMAAKNHFGEIVWNEWDDEIKFRNNSALQKLGEELSEEIDFQKFLQFIFFRQWFALKEYANKNGVEIIGDVPLYVSTDSADIWTNTDIFLLDENLKPTEVGGVPPDYFSETGQLWGNPVFNWQRLKERNYDWWTARLHFNLKMFNQVRIDHFRGLESFWSIPANEKTAINGKWVPAFGYELLAKMKEQTGELYFIAEDLGLITPEVDKLRDEFNLPGMKVLQFAFSTDSAHKDLPHNYSENFAVYSGTHDNDTTLGWLKTVKGDERKLVIKYLGGRNKKALRKAIELALSSVAKTAIIPMQDILELGSKSRMNIPGTSTGNWGWRFYWRQIKRRQKRFLKELTEKYNR
ncbi:MAG: 4-alpha-glucanotransferase [Draconibacterium sp.]|nr:4-alpha-glucanotransferase [Draconibacterium sp.]